MTSYIPCMECKNRYGREYSKICDGFCDYAKAVKEKKQLEAFKDFWAELYGKNYGLSRDCVPGIDYAFDRFFNEAIKRSDSA